jgi:hypothetical protein
MKDNELCKKSLLIKQHITCLLPREKHFFKNYYYFAASICTTVLPYVIQLPWANMFFTNRFRQHYECFYSECSIETS